MASHSASGLTKEERKKFLRDHGFVPAHDGKGSHEVWEHPELKALAQSHDITPPANLLSNIAQKPWETTLCANPASGTWRAMAKHAEWCQDTVEHIKTAAARDLQRAEICRQFRDAVNDVCQWKKDVKNWVKAGLAAAKAPQTPMEYRAFLDLKAKKNQLSTPSA